MFLLFILPNVYRALAPPISLPLMSNPDSFEASPEDLLSIWHPIVTENESAQLRGATIESYFRVVSLIRTFSSVVALLGHLFC